ncbi:C2H2-type zinc finger protein [Candidatus Sororendozoicomonas aggregata]|uniref:C2H2-type zinc finger protein n=1 Tax=Candidatus Sororendozoicomonas aggregata TaxID=3073239 RepID=UPI002ED6B1EA
MPKPEMNKQFICAICEKTFLRSDYLTAHMRLHSGEKPYKCQTCGKGFAQSGNCRIHERTHTGVKPHQCDICGKSFTQSSTLNRHTLIHTAEKHYKCGACGKSYARFHDQKEHSMTCRGSSSTISTSTQPLDNGEVAICTTHEVEISDTLVLSASHITRSNASATVTTQHHQGAVVTTVEQKQPNPPATINTNPGLKDPAVDPMWPQFDTKNTDSPITSVFYTGDINFGTENILADIPDIPDIPDMTN